MSLLESVPSVENMPRNTQKLWYRKPAVQWDHGLPVGNGRLGAVVFGGIERERIQLNEDTLWAGCPRNTDNPDAFNHLGKVRDLLFAGNPVLAAEVAEANLLGTPKTIKPFQALGDLSLHFLNHSTVDDYHFELDLDTAVVSTSYRSNGSLFHREVFASYPAQLIAMRLSCDNPAGLTFEVSLGREADSATETVGETGLAMECRLEDGAGLHCWSELRLVPEGGEVTPSGDMLCVRGADRVTILFSSVTNYRDPDPRGSCCATLDAAENKQYMEILADHLADYRSLFCRVELDLGESAVSSAMPTDERLKAVQDGVMDHGLIELYFHYARYLLIASSRANPTGQFGTVDRRPVSLPANLQGLWNESLSPPWGSDYHLNINLQMNYWPAESAGLPECHLPLFDLVESLIPFGQGTARTHYGCKGFVAHHITDIWGFTAPGDGASWGLWPMGGAWLALHFWEHYAFSGDQDFLRDRALPVLVEASKFFLDYLVDDAHGNLVSGPSMSPENQYILSSGSKGVLCMGPSMDTQIVRELFDRTLDAAHELQAEPNLCHEIRAALERLPAHKIGRHGQLQEWQEDYHEEEPGHRHMSHLFALHPGTQINPKQTPQLAEAARVVLERRLSHGGGHTGWSRAWIINFWARLGDGDQAYGHLAELLTQSTLPNLWDLHPPFQIDGNFGGAGGILEMLLQSQGDEVVFLPALPAVWPEGSFEGFRARTGLTVDLAWRQGRCHSATLVARVDATHNLRCPSGQMIGRVTCGDQELPLTYNTEGCCVISFDAGNTYRLCFTEAV